MHASWRQPFEQRTPDFPIICYWEVTCSDNYVRTVRMHGAIGLYCIVISIPVRLNSTVVDPRQPFEQRTYYFVTSEKRITSIQRSQRICPPLEAPLYTLCHWNHTSAVYCVLNNYDIHGLRATVYRDPSVLLDLPRYRVHATISCLWPYSYVYPVNEDRTQQ